MPFASSWSWCLSQPFGWMLPMGSLKNAPGASGGRFVTQKAPGLAPPPEGRAAPAESRSKAVITRNPVRIPTFNRYEHLFSVAIQSFNLPYLFSALRTRHVWSESAGSAVAAAFGVRQLVGAFARGTGES